MRKSSIEGRIRRLERGRNRSRSQGLRKPEVVDPETWSRAAMKYNTELLRITQEVLTETPGAVDKAVLMEANAELARAYFASFEKEESES